jgi:hypothetical protein
MLSLAIEDSSGVTGLAATGEEICAQHGLLKRRTKSGFSDSLKVIDDQ